MFSGGDIKNVVLNSARLASGDLNNKTQKINQTHLIEACKIVLEGKQAQNCVITDYYMG